MKKFKDLKLTYIPHSCVVVTIPHYDLHYDGGKGKRYNLACISCSDTKKEGIALLRKMVKNYNDY